MEFDSVLHYFNTILELFLLDLLLSGDNAVVIAMACRRLPPKQKRQAILIGTGGAMVLRILMAGITGFLLNIPLIKIIGGVLLVVIAIKLLMAEEAEQHPDQSGMDSTVDLWSAVSTVVVADVVMSLDNVMGLAAAAQGNIVLLTLGLLMSMPLLMFGSLFVQKLLDRYPFMIRGGGALLGWLAGDIVVSDALIADWINQQSPALTVVIPALTAVFVLRQSTIINSTWPTLALMRQQIRSVIPAVAKKIVHADLKHDSTSPSSSQEVIVDAAVSVQSVIKSSVPIDRLSAAPADFSIDTKADPKSKVSELSRIISGPWPWIGAAVAVGFMGFNFFANHWIPEPNKLRQYDCTNPDATLNYRHGAEVIQLIANSSYVSGIVKPDNQISWGDYHATTQVLGIAPPTHVKYDDDHSVVIDGGAFADTKCIAHFGS